MTTQSKEFTVYIVEDELEVTLAELSQACGVHAEWLIALVDEGIIEPLSSNAGLRFSGACIQRARVVQRLQQELGINLAGAALALDLLDEIEVLRERLTALGAE
jgi:chaperone modulatory protein CbpM